MVNLRKCVAIAFLIFGVLFFYSPLIVSSRIPVPADTIVGLYNPFRDYYVHDFPNGVPFKNFLITDPVRQTYIWKELSVDILKKGTLPVWNPYEMSGKPLIGNFQSGAFYPLNILLFIPPFYMSWSVFILLQSLLLGVFMYLYLKNLGLKNSSALLGSIAVTFSGFSVSWLEWGTIIATALWLPLILYSIDRIISGRSKHMFSFALLLIALVFSFFAGHLQTFFYMYVISFFYLLVRLLENKKNKKAIFGLVTVNLLFVIIAAAQWIPTLQFLMLSARNTDQSYSAVEGWFIPWKHLIQFVAPDFFGNPTTLNYWGTWNYGELIGYIGVIPFVLSCYSLYKRDRTVIFFVITTAVSLLMALPTGISAIPYALHVPFISTSQPTRLLFPVVFSLSVLAAIGFSYLFDIKKTVLKHFIPVALIALLFAGLWLVVGLKSTVIFAKLSDAQIAGRNLVFPSIIFCLAEIFVSVVLLFKQMKLKQFLLLAIIVVTFFDLFRFAQKFTPFTDHAYLFPATKTISFLQSQKGLFRIASMDRRIMPPNFFTHYKLQSIEGYDPLYLNTYAEFISAMERNKPDIAPPFGFNRIITPHNIDSPLFDLLNAKYVLSLDEINKKGYTKVFEEGQTKVYENTKSLERLFFVANVLSTKNDIQALFQNNLTTTAIVTNPSISSGEMSVGSISNIFYNENDITMTTNNQGDGFLIFTDAYYPTWKAYVDGVATQIFPTDHAFRGIFVPKGSHTVQFKDNLF